MRELSPKISVILNMFEPIMLPNTKLDCFLEAAITEVTNSGTDVPIAMATREISASEIPMTWARAIDESITTFPLIGRRVHPKRKRKLLLTIEREECSEIPVSSCRLPKTRYK